MKRILILFSLLVLVSAAIVISTSMAGCNKSNSDERANSAKQARDNIPEVKQIAPTIAINPEHELLALMIGTPPSGKTQYNRPNYRAIVIDLSTDAGSKHFLPFSNGFTPFTWRPKSDQLFLIENLDKIQRYGATDLKVISPEIEIPDKIVISIGDWNSSGTTLALSWHDLSPLLQSKTSSPKLAFLSESSNWKPHITDINLADRRMAWIGDSSLYIESTNGSDDEVLEFEVSKSDLKMIRSVAKAVWLEICGSIGDDVIFHDGQTVFRDSDAIYKCPSDIYGVYVGSSLVAVRTVGGIVVLSSDGKVIAEKQLESNDVIGALSPYDSQLYLITKERTRIERMSAITLRDSKIIYSVYEK